MAQFTALWGSMWRSRTISIYIQFSFDTVHCGSGGKAAVLPVFVGRLVSVGHFSVFSGNGAQPFFPYRQGLPPWMDFRHEDSEYGQASDRFITKSGLER